MSAGVIPFLLLGFLMATTPGHVITIASPSPQFTRLFGTVMDAANGLLLVGVPDQLVNGIAGAGDAFLFDARTGSLVRTIISPDPQKAGLFGTSVEIADNTLIISAFGETVPGIFAAGRVYVFNTATGSLLKTLTISNSTSFGFGERVEEADGLLAISSNDAAHGIPEAGRVYIYNATDYSLIRTLVSPNAQLSGQFGTGLEIADGLIAVGANLENVDNVQNVGRAYVYNASTGSLISSIVPPDTNTGFFGGELDLSAGLLYVGGFTTVNGLPAAGAVYIFDAITGSMVRTLTSPNPERSGLFGSAIEIFQHTIIVGAQLESVNGIPFAGRVYFFDASTGSLMRTLTDPTGQTGPFRSTFGSSIESSTGRLFVGAASETLNSSVGAVFIFSGNIANVHHDDPDVDQNQN